MAKCESCKYRKIWDEHKQWMGCYCSNENSELYLTDVEDDEFCDNWEDGDDGIEKFYPM